MATVEAPVGEKRPREPETAAAVTSPVAADAAPQPPSGPVDPSKGITLDIAGSNAGSLSPSSSPKVAVTLKTDAVRPPPLQPVASPTFAAPAAVVGAPQGPTATPNSGGSSSSQAFPPAPMVRLKSKSALASPMSTAAPSPASVSKAIPVTASRPVVGPKPVGVPAGVITSNVALTSPASIAPRPKLASPGSMSAPQAPPVNKNAAFAQKIAKPIAEALLKTAKTDEEKSAIPDIAKNVAEQLSLQREASSAAKTLFHNLDDPLNDELRVKVISGEISPATLAGMDSLEMANPKLRQQRADEFAERARHRNWVELKNSLTTNTALFRCPKCGSKECSLRSHKQTRSGDEPMTATLDCLKCGTVFKRQA